MAGYLLQAKWKQTGLIFGILYSVYCLWSLTRLFEVTSYHEFHAGTESEFPMEFLGYLGVFGTLASAVFLLSLRWSLQASGKHDS